MKLETALEEIKTKPVVALWPTVATSLNMSRGSVYEAARRHEIDVIRVGHRIKALSAPLRKKLGIDAA